MKSNQEKPDEKNDKSRAETPDPEFPLVEGYSPPPRKTPSPKEDQPEPDGK